MKDIQKPQVGDNYYSTKKYNHLKRFIAYYYQFSSILDLKPKTVLEVGSGSNITAELLRKSGIEVSVSDIDKQVNPDIVSDVRDIKAPDNNYDVVAAFQILEHIPFDELDKALSELSRVSKKYAVISVPYKSTGFEFVLMIPFMRTLFKKDFLDFHIRWPLKFHGFEKSGQHYWEIDSKDFKLKKVRKELEKHFTIKKEFSPALNKFHHFFILEKK